MEIKSTTLANGLKIIFSKKSSTPLVSLQCYVRVGSCWEDNNEAGFSHFMEHLVFKASKEFPDSSHIDYISNYGGNINAYTEYDSTCFYTSLPAKFTDKGLHVLSQLVRFPVFDEEDFSYEKGVVIEELKQYQNDPEDFFVEETPKYYFTKNPIRKPIIGTYESINNSTFEQLNAFHKKYYNPSNTFIVVTGDYSDDIIELIQRYFGNWESGLKISKKPEVFEYPDTFQFKKIETRFRSDFLAFLLPELSDRDVDSHALSLAGKAFCVGKNSRLHKRLIVEEKIVDSLRVHSLSGIHDGVSVIIAIPKAGVDPIDIIKIFKEEKEKFLKNGLSYDELKAQINELQFSYRYSQEYIESFGMSIGQEEILTGYEEFLKYIQKINSITANGIKIALRNYFSNKRLQIYYMGKKELDQNLIASLFPTHDEVKHSTKEDKIFHQFSLSNGLKIIYKRIKNQPTIGLSLINPVSQLSESSNQRGLNVVSQSLLMYGNKRRNHSQMIDYCTERGINISTSSGSETSSIKVKCFSELFENALELIRDMVTEPLFPNDYINSIKKTYISSFDRMKDYPYTYAFYLWKEQIFGKNSQLVYREGSKKDVRKLTKKRIQEWFNNHRYYPNMSLGIVGDLDPSYLRDCCEKYLGLIQSSSDFDKANLIIESNSKKFIQKKIKSDQSAIFMGGFSPSSKDKKKNTALFLLSQIMGGDLNSRLFTSLREDHGLAYTVGCESKSLLETGFYNMYALVDSKKEMFAIDLIKEQIKSIREKGVTAEELKIAKNYLNGMRLFEEESVSAQSMILGTLDVLGLGLDHYLTREKRVEAVTNQMIKDVANEYMKDEDLFTYVLS